LRWKPAVARSEAVHDDDGDEADDDGDEAEDNSDRATTTATT
jgi:hypothetical protein